jgi:isoleucyl-tRNA synthetase
MTLTEDKKAAYLTLWEMLTTVSRLMAPFAPFLAEEIFINLTDEESVHLQDFPHENTSLIDDKLETEMQTVIDLVSLGRAARNECQIKVRQPLTTMYIPMNCHELVARNEWLVKEEINIKDIKYVRDDEGFVAYDMKVNFKKMGPRFGKDVKRIATALETINTGEIVKSLDTTKSYTLEMEGEKFDLTAEDLVVTIKNREGFTFASEKGLWVALDIQLNPELIMEGLARELVNKIQFTRKENDFEIMDRIRIDYHSEDSIREVFSRFGDYIKSETLTDIIEYQPITADLKEYDINDNTVWMKITKNK